MTVLSYSNNKSNGRSPFLNVTINNWLQFLFSIKATALKQQISKLCPQIQRLSQRLVINVKASMLTICR